mgnify:CR=1 FL=1
MIALLAVLSTSAFIQGYQEKSFLNWMRANNKFYTGDEYKFRLGIYLANSKLVQQHNKANKNFKVSLNKFSTYTPAEYKVLLGEISQIPKRRLIKSQTKKDWPTPPAELDWREKGAVNAAVDQGQCGSCWAFGSIAGAEGCWFLNKAELLKYSEQNLVDCVVECEGCYGGLRDAAYNYVIQNQGGQFQLEADYPYTAVGDVCQFDARRAVGGIRGFVQPTPEDENDLLAHVAHYGPTTIGIDASSWDFQAYTSGIFDNGEDCHDDYINHGVCCVGYGTENDVDYWIVRNSWGANWGEQGFIRMIRGQNICGISSRAYSVYYDNQ